jgi:hypothetical protein
MISTNDNVIQKILSEIWLDNKSEYELVKEWHPLYCIANNKVMEVKSKYNITINGKIYEKWFTYRLRELFNIDWKEYFEFIKYL